MWGVSNIVCSRGLSRKFSELVCYCLVLLFIGIAGVPDDSLEFQKHLPAHVVWGVQGRDVELPCDVTPPTPADSVSMVFWFKDSIGIPLYSLDARGGPLSQASHLTICGDLGSRSYFLTDGESSPARLQIKRVRPEDEGVFRCRVDFTNSPTRNFRVNFTLVVQPSYPRIFDSEGHEVHNTAGPFLQGHDLFLSCQVTGGRPAPIVTWWHNGSLIDSVVDSTSQARTTVNQLFISNVTRSLWSTRLECRATADPIAGYRSKEVTLNVYLMPQKVKISALDELLSTRMPHLFRCETSGSYPPAKVVWLLGNKSLRNSSVTVSETEDSTTSMLTLLAAPEDDGKELVCRADNPRFPGGSLQDSKTIRVAYPPKVSVHFGSAADLSFPASATSRLLKEGGHVTLVCKAKSVPPAHKYTWYHNGHMVGYDESAGTLPSDHMLELKGLNRSSEGEYSCAAGNSEGETLSEPLRLRIQYAPRCREGHESVEVGAVVHEPLLVKCVVDANPAMVKFSWTYNNSRDVLPVQAANRMNNNGVISQLQFTPGAGDLGTLACWASNVIGRQITPCLFHLVPAKLPDPPHDCSLRTPCERCVEVICEPGEDGGLMQSFVLEVNEIPVAPPERMHGGTTLSDQGTQAEPLYRVQENEPVFRLTSLEPGRDYQLTVYAENARGRSTPPVTLSNFRPPRDTVPMPVGTERPETDEADDSLTPPAKHSLTLILGALIAGAALVVAGATVVAVIIVCKRRTPRPSPVTRRRRDDKTREESLELQEDHGFGEGFQRRSMEWRERGLRASLYLHDAGGGTSQHITIGPDLILSPVTLSQPQQPQQQLQSLVIHPQPSSEL